MFDSHFQRRGALCTAACAASAVLVFASQAGAKESKHAVCTAAYSAYKSAAEREKAGHLREARDLLSSCAQATSCGGLVPKCAARYDQLVSRMPTVVPVVTDPNGSAVYDVEVKVDGQVLTSKLDGRGVPVEAGGHEFTFSTRGSVFATRQVLVVEGERNRRVEASLGGPPSADAAKAEAARPLAVSSTAATAPQEEKATEKGEGAPPEPVEASGAGAWALPKSPVPYVIGAAGLGGLVAGGLLTYWGNKDNDLAKAQCNHLCPQSVADHIQTMYIAADVAFGVGAAGLAVATWLFASSRSTEAKAPPRSAYVLDMHPTRAGGVVTVSGAF